jgi:hypothetical protein
MHRRNQCDRSGSSRPRGASSASSGRRQHSTELSAKSRRGGRAAYKLRPIAPASAPFSYYLPLYARIQGSVVCAQKKKRRKEKPENATFVNFEGVWPGLRPRISTRFRHGDMYKVRIAWNHRVRLYLLHRAPTRRSKKRALHLGLRRLGFRGGSFGASLVSPIERMFWSCSWLPCILPASPVSTRRDPTTHSRQPNFGCNQHVLRGSASGACIKRNPRIQP